MDWIVLVISLIIVCAILWILSAIRRKKRKRRIVYIFFVGIKARLLILATLLTALFILIWKTMQLHWISDQHNTPISLLDDKEGIIILQSLAISGMGITIYWCVLYLYYITRPFRHIWWMYLLSGTIIFIHETIFPSSIVVFIILFFYSCITYPRKLANKPRVITPYILLLIAILCLMFGKLFCAIIAREILFLGAMVLYFCAIMTVPEIIPIGLIK
jgi:hypothetical protein